MCAVRREKKKKRFVVFLQGGSIVDRFFSSFFSSLYASFSGWLWHVIMRGESSEKVPYFFFSSSSSSFISFSCHGRLSPATFSFSAANHKRSRVTKTSIQRSSGFPFPSASPNRNPLFITHHKKQRSRSTTPVSFYSLPNFIPSRLLYARLFHCFKLATTGTSPRTPKEFDNRCTTPAIQPMAASNHKSFAKVPRHENNNHCIITTFDQPWPSSLDIINPTSQIALSRGEIREFENGTPNNANKKKGKEKINGRLCDFPPESLVVFSLLSSWYLNNHWKGRYWVLGGGII